MKASSRSKPTAVKGDRLSRFPVLGRLLLPCGVRPRERATYRPCGASRHARHRTTVEGPEEFLNLCRRKDRLPRRRPKTQFASVRAKNENTQITDAFWTASGPRYRGSTPCLPAKFDPRVGTSCKPKKPQAFHRRDHAVADGNVNLSAQFQFLTVFLSVNDAASASLRPG